jgi:hypothetical protein
MQPTCCAPLPDDARAQAEALRAAFPGYVVNLIMSRGDRPRFEVVNRSGGNPYCLISTDAREIWRELRGRWTDPPSPGTTV